MTGDHFSDPCLFDEEAFDFLEDISCVLDTNTTACAEESLPASSLLEMVNNFSTQATRPLSPQTLADSASLGGASTSGLVSDQRLPAVATQLFDEEPVVLSHGVGAATLRTAPSDN